ncbi:MULTISPECIES: DUF2147 domain-containing protein [unclassified Leeuwenhoekiella]|uniref:DUF2147 domain-containing protein n=1 Tax=unclassified Leeuwenhoekiella TaxID=2615029 RepID=UPI000C47F884|nr:MULTISPECIES: DUF2147 domain-containing protein [unclassified Leeuwenhoekiella]MAW94910.1 hypothetical protein [Leeuwenhoekiella sp.]MBA79630.1 hypothetical protein [Leeuwenhoekiella sp.]|tara:strand:+ start:1760 stop:2188 length:429 start_codon:yes stop_codon:yes gene_type:complete
MKKITAFIMFALFATAGLFAQDVTGKWKSIDDETGEAKSIIEIYKKDGKVYGKIVEILNKDRQDAKCTECDGVNKDKPILGMVIMNGLEKDGDEYDGGTILDPQSGKVYKCLIELEEANKLKVRGYIGFSLLGRTQYWTRVQ